MLTIYEERGFALGIVRGKRDLVLRLLRNKFGALPEAVITAVQQIRDGEELDRLAERVLTAVTLREIGLPDR